MSNSSTKKEEKREVKGFVCPRGSICLKSMEGEAYMFFEDYIYRGVLSFDLWVESQEGGTFLYEGDTVTLTL